jgi:type II secretory pathway component PulF
MIYPSIIITALIVMVTFMMIFVIPRITEVLSQYNVDLPLQTKILIWLSNTIIHYGFIIFPVLILLVFLFVRWTKTKKGKWRWDSFVLKIPQLKKVIIEFNLARFTRALSSMLKSGVRIDHALDLAAEVSGNSHYQKSIKKGINFVQKGIPLTEVLKGYPKLYPPITTRMVEIGEKTGKLDHMLSRLAEFYEKSVSTAIGNLASVIEPILLLAIGLAVAFVAISVLTPIWSFQKTI